MNTAASLLCLPLLHPKTAAEHPSFPSMARHVWPGLPHVPDNFWQPQDLPFSPQEAALCLIDLQNMSEAALQGMPLQALAKQQNPADMAQRMDEQDALARFAESGEREEESPAMTLLKRKTAHKTLLWAWLLEERHREVRELTHNYSQNAQNLMTGLGIEHDDALATLGSIESLLAEGNIPLPSWQMVMENVAFFLPEQCSIVVNHPSMAEYIAENAELAPVSAEGIALLGLAKEEAVLWHEAQLPLYMLCKSKQGKEHLPWLQKMLRCYLKEVRP